MQDPTERGPVSTIVDIETYHVWEFNRRRNGLFMVTGRRKAHYVGSIPAVWATRAGANAWAKRETTRLKYGYKVLKCDGVIECDMGNHTIED